MPHFASPHLAMPGLGQGSGPGNNPNDKMPKPSVKLNQEHYRFINIVADSLRVWETPIPSQIAGFRFDESLLLFSLINR